MSWKMRENCLNAVILFFSLLPRFLSLSLSRSLSVSVFSLSVSLSLARSFYLSLALSFPLSFILSNTMYFWVSGPLFVFTYAPAFDSDRREEIRLTAVKMNRPRKNEQCGSLYNFFSETKKHL